MSKFLIQIVTAFYFLEIFSVNFCNATLHPIFTHSYAKTLTVKMSDNPPPAASVGLNNIDKHGKNDPKLATHSPPTTTTRSTPTPTPTPTRPNLTFGYHILHFQNTMSKIRDNHTKIETQSSDVQTGSDHSTHLDTEEKMRRIIELTLLMCGVTVVFVILFLSIRISAHLYKKFKGYTSQRFANSSNSSSVEPSVHFTAGSVNSSEASPSASAPPAPIYTVMPGHFVLQPCFSSTSRGSGENSRNSSATPAGTSSGSGTEPFRFLASHPVNVAPPIPRSETPPPPYPGSPEDKKI